MLINVISDGAGGGRQYNLLEQTSLSMTDTTASRRKFPANKLSPIGTCGESSLKHIESRAAELLELHPQFRGRSRLVKVRCAGNRLILSGCLPSYYLKQLAQEALRELAAYEVENNILVFGLPSDPGHSKSDQLGADLAHRIPR